MTDTKTVPIDPTGPMILAGQEAVGFDIAGPNIEAIWTAMVESAPTREPGSVIHCGPDGPVAIKPEKDNGERSGSASGYRPPMPSKRWLGTV